jgi:hypothetical protein
VQTLRRRLVQREEGDTPGGEGISTTLADPLCPHSTAWNKISERFWAADAWCSTYPQPRGPSGGGGPILRGHSRERGGSPRRGEQFVRSKALTLFSLWSFVAIDVLLLPGPRSLVVSRCSVIRSLGSGCWLVWAYCRPAFPIELRPALWTEVRHYS